jgi:hypothetical protein
LLAVAVEVDACVVEPKTWGNRWRRPARIVGRQEHSIAVVVSIVVQNVIGMLSQVGSAIKPKVLIVYRRTMEVMQTLRNKGKF